MTRAAWASLAVVVIAGGCATAPPVYPTCLRDCVMPLDTIPFSAVALANTEEVYEEVLENVPIIGFQRGFSISLWLRLDTDGRVQEAMLAESSGYPEVDRGVIRSFSRAQFLHGTAGGWYRWRMNLRGS